MLYNAYFTLDEQHRVLQALFLSDWKEVWRKSKENVCRAPVKIRTSAEGQVENESVKASRDGEQRAVDGHEVPFCWKPPFSSNFLCLKPESRPLKGLQCYNPPPLPVSLLFSQAHTLYTLYVNLIHIYNYGDKHSHKHSMVTRNTYTNTQKSKQKVHSKHRTDTNTLMFVMV